MTKDDIILLVKKEIAAIGEIDAETDTVTLDSNGVDHIAENIANALVDEERDEAVILTKEDLHKYAKDCLIGELAGYEILNGLIARNERMVKETRESTLKSVARYLDNEIGFCGLGWRVLKHFGVEVEE